jgi:Rha family phage regulatory protein
MSNLISQEPIVAVKDGAVYANSRDVAAFFGKRHDNVLADVNNILSTPDISGMGLFISVQSPHPTVVGRMIPSWDMTKDGFTLLVMGYTGQKAMAFKLAYIQRFNEMEEALKAPVVPAVPQTYLEALKACVAAVERAEAAESTVNRLASCPDMMGIQEAAKALKISPKAFGKLLREWGWVYDRRGTKRSKLLAYQGIIDKGWMIHDAVELDDGSIKYHPKITGEGLVQAAKRLDS